MSQQLPHIQIEGRSGCRLEIVRGNDLVLVRKYSSNNEYNKRLIKQEQKQVAFNTDALTQIGFYSPKVVNNGSEDGLYWFEMHYAGGEKYSTYFTHITKSELDDLIKKLIAYFKLAISNSTQIETPLQIIHQKINDLSIALNKRADIPIALAKQTIDYLTQHIPDSPIYIGNCHGDFTLSNMLFTPKGDIITFDLLDSFLESPIIDLVKLRQDTRYHWSMFVEQGNFTNSVKLKQILAYIDNKLMQAIGNDLCIQKWEKYITVFNFARILPYAKDDRDINYLNSHLTTILNT